MALSISFGVAQYGFIKVLESINNQPVGVSIISILLLIFSYPVSLYCIFKCMRPLHNRLIIFSGLFLQSIGIFTLSVYYSDMGDYFKLIGLLCPLLSQVGLVFVIVSSLPDMLETVTTELPSIEQGVIADRICSTVFIAYNKGSLLMLIMTVVLEIFTNTVFGSAICSLFILGFALIYEYNVRGVWDYFYNGSSRGAVKGIEFNESRDFSNWLSS